MIDFFIVKSHRIYKNPTFQYYFWNKNIRESMMFLRSKSFIPKHLKEEKYFGQISDENLLSPDLLDRLKQNRKNLTAL